MGRERMRAQPLGLRWCSKWGHENGEGCADMKRGRHANVATREGRAEMVEGRMRTSPLGPSVELRMGPRSV
eukprot:292455-Pyramimonas_sp.AAC.1